jgi:hypothetical protein
MEVEEKPVESERKKFKKKYGPAEWKNKRGALKEAAPVPLNNVWQEARSKNEVEKQEALDTLSLMFVLFESAFDIKAEESCDPLEDLETALQEPLSKSQRKRRKRAKPVETLESFDRQFNFIPRKADRVPVDFSEKCPGFFRAICQHDYR